MSNQHAVTDSIRILLNFARSRLGADSAAFYQYYQRLDQLDLFPVIVGNVDHPSTFRTLGGIPADIRRVLSTRKIWYWIDASGEKNRDADYVIREGIASYVVAPLVVKDEVLGVLLINYRTSMKFSSSERQSIERVIRYVTTTMSNVNALDRNDQANSQNLLSFSLPLPPLLYPAEFFDRVSHVIYAVSLLYSLFALLESNQTDIIRACINELSDPRNFDENSTALLSRYLEIIDFEPLRISSIRYGSPVSVDLLGVGSALETLRETLRERFENQVLHAKSLNMR
jgi:GAF domain